VRTRSIRVAVVANRVRSAQVYRPLERFLGSLGLPFLTRISDSEVYVRAAESGLGVFDMDESAAAEREELMPIVDWVGGQRAPEVLPERKVIDLKQSRWTDRIRVPFSRQGLSSVSGSS
jgi:hypothetical protein